MLHVTGYGKTFAALLLHSFIPSIVSVSYKVPTSYMASVARLAPSCCLLLQHTIVMTVFTGCEETLHSTTLQIPGTLSWQGGSGWGVAAEREDPIR